MYTKWNFCKFRSTSRISSGLESKAAPIPPLREKDLGQPMLISMAATSLFLKIYATVKIMLFYYKYNK